MTSESASGDHNPLLAGDQLAGLGLKGLGLASWLLPLGFALYHVSRCPLKSVERCDPPSLVGAVSTALSLLRAICSR